MRNVFVYAFILSYSFSAFANKIKSTPIVQLDMELELKVDKSCQASLFSDVIHSSLEVVCKVPYGFVLPKEGSITYQINDDLYHTFEIVFPKGADSFQVIFMDQPWLDDTRVFKDGDELAFLNELIEYFKDKKIIFKLKYTGPEPKLH